MRTANSRGDDERAHYTETRSGPPERYFVSFGLFAVLFRGKRQRKAGAMSNFAFSGHVAAHRSRQITADGKAQSASFLAARERAAELNERLEDRLDLVLRNARSRIPHADESLLAGRRTSHFDAAALRRELYRVREEIEN